MQPSDCGEIQRLCEVMADVELDGSDDTVVRMLAAQGGCLLNDGAEQRHKVARERIRSGRAFGVHFVDQCQEILLEAPACRDSENRRRRRKERLGDDLPAEFSCKTDIRFAPACSRVWPIAVPFAGMEYDERSSRESYAFAADEFKYSFAFENVEQLVLVAAEGASVLPCEIVF